MSVVVLFGKPTVSECMLKVYTVNILKYMEEITASYIVFHSQNITAVAKQAQ